jgi:hypothetical protein
MYSVPASRKPWQRDRQGVGAVFDDGAEHAARVVMLYAAKFDRRRPAGSGMPAEITIHKAAALSIHDNFIAECGSCIELRGRQVRRLSDRAGNAVRATPTVGS